MTSSQETAADVRPVEAAWNRFCAALSDEGARVLSGGTDAASEDESAELQLLEACGAAGAGVTWSAAACSQALVVDRVAGDGDEPRSDPAPTGWQVRR
jgi:hypothetical protein